MDVLGYSLDEIGGVTGVEHSGDQGVAASWARALARTGAGAGRDPLPVLAEPERSRLAAYVDRFNARDFDAVRDMLGEEVRLELVNRTRRTAAARSNVFRQLRKGPRLATRARLRRPASGHPGATAGWAGARRPTSSCWNGRRQRRDDPRLPPRALRDHGAEIHRARLTEVFTPPAIARASPSRASCRARGSACRTVRRSRPAG